MIQVKIEGLKNIEKEIMSIAVKEAKNHLTNSIKRIRCPVHGSLANVEITGTNPENLDVKVTGCCEELIAKVKKELKLA